MSLVLRCVVMLVAMLALFPGATAPVQQDPIPPPPQDPIPPPQGAPHELIDAALSLVVALGDGQVITKGQTRSLTVKLEDARHELWQADAGASIRHLRAFSQQVGALAQGGQLPPKDAETLADYATQATDAIGELAFEIPSVLAGKLSCAPQAPCPQPLILYVNSRKSRQAPDGSRDRPFRSITAALAAAEEVEACGVEIRLARGAYAGDILVSRHTRIIGDETRRTIVRGSVINQDGYDLDLRGLTISSSPAPGGVVIAPCAATVNLSAVAIDNATRYGVRQNGGSLRMFAVQVRDTVAQSDDVYAGSGVRLTGGTQAVIGLSGIHGSGSVGLSLSDSGTRAYVAASLVSDGHVNVAFEDGLANSEPGHGGVEVMGDALLFMELSLIRNNEAFGLSVQDGGRAHFRYGGISGTKDRRIGGGLFAGFNVDADDGGTVQFTDFGITRADFVGIRIDSAFVTMSSGMVSENVIGVVVRSPPPGQSIFNVIDCLSDRVAFVRNDRNFDGEPPVPCGSDCPPRAPCGIVPPVCAWCGS